jgi:hypothetical protein
VWITRDAQDKLTRDNTRLAEQIAVEQAGNPVLMNLARARRKKPSGRIWLFRCRLPVTAKSRSWYFSTENRSGVTGVIGPRAPL